ncbi:hypothetical protein [Candidatus Enterovibrio escicola]|uniref:Uncharacterized protein n=1 Tax=Candidatus Enterovibrio escicola TaxID=1927127 RepID=A0A2A5T7I4_9GAMM|nr:hypothetical protein [Candidatus Enterovibrio escacola]PCS24107.1 hypothetical protein BTN49_0101 [Candidatus Enterovibrio escacola]
MNNGDKAKIKNSVDTEQRHDIPDGNVEFYYLEIDTVIGIWCQPFLFTLVDKTNRQMVFTAKLGWMTNFACLLSSASMMPAARKC